MSHNEQALINERYSAYWIGRKYQEENNLLKAIEAYKVYATHLAPEDQHIPHQWIAEFYDQLGEKEHALYHFEIFAKGCSKAVAAEVYKGLGNDYLALNNIKKAIESYELALRNDENIGVKKMLYQLKKSVYV
jgi:tetratricopeptide (TPR) repeat protein